MSVRGAGRLWCAAVVAGLGATGLSCGDVKSGPDVPFSIEFRPLQLPSMLVGEELHDTLGNVDSLRAFVFNSSGDTIPDAVVHYLHADTTRKVDIVETTGHVTASDTGFSRVVAQTTGLQSPPESLFVVQRPDLFASITPLEDTLISAPVRDSIFALTVHLTSGGDPVDHWRVEYRILSPDGLNDNDSTHIMLSTEGRKFSLVDTTASEGATTGTATRYLRVSRFAHTFDGMVVVEARAFYPDHTVVPGSPKQFNVQVHIP